MSNYKVIIDGIGLHSDEGLVLLSANYYCATDTKAISNAARLSAVISVYHVIRIYHCIGSTIDSSRPVLLERDCGAGEFWS